MKQKNSKLSNKFDLFYLDLFLLKVLDFSSYTNLSSLKSLDQMIQLIDKSDYDDVESLSRIWMVKKLIKTRLANIKLSSAEELLEKCDFSGKFEEDVDEIIDDLNESFYENEDIDLDEDIIFITEYISKLLKYQFINDYQESLENILIKNRGCDFDDIDEHCQEFADMIHELHKKFTLAECNLKDAENDFSTEDISMVQSIENSLSQLNDEACILKSSIKKKNQMLNGGYESGRLVIVCGKQGGGKSIELLQCALDFKSYNNKLKIEGNKKPVILFITQENSIRETWERIWSFYMGNSDEFKKHTTKEIIDILSKETNFLKGPELIVKYRKSKSITTDDIAGFVDKIEEDKEHKVISIIHDYIKRVRPLNPTGNTYTDLGDITDEMCNIAKEKNLVFITAMQFKRDGLQKLEQAYNKDQNDPLKHIENTDIGESIKIVDNADVIYSIHRQSNPITGELMLSYKLTKYRGKPNPDPVTYFSHPFAENNTVRLEPDINLTKSLSVENMGNGLEKASIKNLRNVNNNARISNDSKVQVTKKKVSQQEIITGKKKTVSKEIVDKIINE